jgi:VIT1/CCC1 family predicted Fe2+/Mn2+ transporter
MFRQSRDLPTDWDRKPWYRELSLRGWALLLFALFTTFSFVIGVAFGVALLLPFAKSKSGPLAVSLADSPAWFTLVMAVNVIVSVWLWHQFVSWLRRRP